MRTFMLLTAGGPMVIMTSFRSATEQDLLKKLKDKGITKFIAFEIPIELAQQRYGSHFKFVHQDLHETDELRVLDYNGDRVFQLFSFDELGGATRYEAGQSTTGSVEVREADDVQ